MTYARDLLNATIYWPMPDPVCNNCRARKVKCGRERPECANCLKEKTHCDYSDRGKRINHTKLLANNVSELDDHLAVIRGQLQHLTSIIEKQGQSSVIKPQPAQQRADPAHVQTDSAPTPRQNIFSSFSRGETEPDLLRSRHITRSPFDASERTHGPCSFFSLCKALERSISNTRNGDMPHSQHFFEPAQDQELQDGFQSLLAATSNNHQLDMIEETAAVTSSPLRLPSEQLLRVSSAFLFTHTDPDLDIFEQSNLSANIERLYRNGPSPTDYPWILSFNLIVFLVLNINQPCADSHTTTAAQSAKQLLSILGSTLKSQRLMISVSLINVQALLLLTVALQRCLQVDFAESTFANACFLAKQMGLHHRRFDYENLTDDAKSHVKVFFYLFVRDKVSCLAKGISCCLPYTDCNLSFQDANKYLDKTASVRIELATVQEEIYQRLYSAISYSQETSQRIAAVISLKEHLAALWELSSGQRPLELTMAIIAAQIAVSHRDPRPEQRACLLEEARSYCRTFLQAAYREGIVPYTTGDMSSTQSESYPSMYTGNTELVALPTSTQGVKQQAQYLAENFSPLAFFTLAEDMASDATNDAVANLSTMSQISEVFKIISFKPSAPAIQCARTSEIFEQVLSVLMIHSNQKALITSSPCPGLPTPALSSSTTSHEIPPDIGDQMDIPPLFSAPSVFDFPGAEYFRTSSTCDMSMSGQSSQYDRSEFSPITKRARHSFDSSMDGIQGLDAQTFMTSDLMTAMLPNIKWKN